MARLGRTFAVFQAGLIGSDGADGVYRAVLPLLAAMLTKSPFDVALVTMATRLPWTLFGWLVGALVDRLELRRSLQLAALSRLVVVVVIGVLFALEELTILDLVLAALIAGAGGVMFTMCAQAMVVHLADDDALDTANARVYSAQVTMNQLAGPSLGALIAGRSLLGSLVAVGGGYALAAGLLGAVPRSTPRRVAESPVSALRHSLVTLTSRADLRRLTIVGIVQNSAYIACLSVLVLYVTSADGLGLSADGFGLLLTCTAVGALIAGPCAPKLLRRHGVLRCLRWATPPIGIGLALIGASTNVVIAAIGLLLYGACLSVWNVAGIGLRQRSTSKERFGGLNATYRWITWGTMPIGALLGGVVGDAFGVRSVFLIFGAIAFAVGFLAPRQLHEHSAPVREPIREPVRS